MAPDFAIDMFCSALIFAGEGAVIRRDTTDPRVSISRSLSRREIPDLQNYAVDRLLQTPNVHQFENTRGGEYRIGMLPAFEIIADARLTANNEPVVLYQTVILRADYPYLVQGLVGGDQADTFVEEFRTITDRIQFGQ